MARYGITGWYCSAKKKNLLALQGEIAACVKHILGLPKRSSHSKAFAILDELTLDELNTVESLSIADNIRRRAFLQGGGSGFRTQVVGGELEHGETSKFLKLHKEMFPEEDFEIPAKPTFYDEELPNVRISDEIIYDQTLVDEIVENSDITVATDGSVLPRLGKRRGIGGGGYLFWDKEGVVVERCAFPLGDNCCSYDTEQAALVHATERAIFLIKERGLGNEFNTGERKISFLTDSQSNVRKLLSGRVDSVNDSQYRCLLRSLSSHWGVQVRSVKGHAGISQNEEADQAADEGMQRQIEECCPRKSVLSRDFFKRQTRRVLREKKFEGLEKEGKNSESTEAFLNLVAEGGEVKAPHIKIDAPRPALRLINQLICGGLPRTLLTIKRCHGSTEVKCNLCGDNLTDEKGAAWRHLGNCCAITEERTIFMGNCQSWGEMKITEGWRDIKFAIDLIKAVKAEKKIIYRPLSRGEGSKVLSSA